MAMIEKIKVLLSETKNNDTRVLLKKATSTLNSSMYGNVPADARVELEKAVVENLFEGLSSIEDEETQEWLKNTKRGWAVKNLGIRTAINTLSVSETASNLSLMQVLDHYKAQLAIQPEVLLYEGFISAMQSFNYFPKVGNAIQAIKDRVDTYEADVSITKILETMKKTRSNYLVPLIEDLVQNYLDNKNMQTKSSLKEGLIKFSYDNFVRDIINLVTADATELQLEYANAQCDIEKVYSPVLYLGENESVFGVRGSYYVKKGNTLSKLQKDHVKRLDPEFTALCEAINSPNVIIDGKSVVLYEGSDKAIITEKKITVNNQEFTNEQFKNSSSIAEWTGKGRFLSLVETFRKNFNEIAEVDFAKRVFLKEDNGYAADIFKLRGNISIATYNPAMGKGTFYRNINPIQAKNLMMEHLRFDVSKAFEDLLPNEEKINEEIKETKKAYSDYILELDQRIEEFKRNPFAKKTSKDVIVALEEELKEIKDEYKDYLNLVEDYMRAPGVNEATIELEIDGPLNLIVGGQKFTVPIPQIDGDQQGSEVDYGEFGTEVGTEDVMGEPASAVTFDDMGSELLSDSPSIQADEVNLGADEIEADADAVEAEAELDMDPEAEAEMGGEGGEGGEGDLEGVEGDGLDSGEDDEIKIEDESDLDLDAGGEDDDLDLEEEPEEEKEKVEDSAGDAKPKGTKKKVYLKKKKKVNEAGADDKAAKWISKPGFKNAQEKHKQEAQKKHQKEFQKKKK
jgi:hypothetical protein